MARKPNIPEDLFADESPADSVRKWAETSTRRKRKDTTAPRRIRQFQSEVERMLKTQDWSKAESGHMVALYMWCHAKVYGVSAADMTGPVFFQATRLAGLFVRNQLKGDYEECVEFIRWVWGREQYREKKRKEEKKEHANRIGWRLQFSPTLVVDYRLDKARKQP